MTGIARLFTQTVTVETFLGSGPYGPKYGDPVTKSCFINGARKLVRDSSGTEVVSSTTLYGPLGDLDAYTPGSRVTDGGNVAQVIMAYRRDSAGPVNIHHTEITLT